MCAFDDMMESIEKLRVLCTSSPHDAVRLFAARALLDAAASFVTEGNLRERLKALEEIEGE